MHGSLIAGVLCMVLSFFAIVTLVWLHVGTGGDIPLDYGIVIDAGSSHSEVLLYKWMSDKLNGTGIVEEQGTCSTKIGIDDNGAQTNVTIKDLMPCIAEIVSKIEVNDDNKEKETPVYLGATAGMRMLNESDPAVSQLVFLSLENAVLRFKSKNNVLNVKTFKIIEGRHEALYAWVTTNYLTGLIPNLGKKLPEVQNTTSVGIMDMGGASAQIAYEVKKEHLLHFETNEIQTLKLYGHEFYVRGETNLCLGGNEQLNRHHALLIMSARGATNIDDPCYNNGAKVELKGEDLLTVCTVPARSSDSVIQADMKYEFKGKYDEKKCQQVIDDNIDPFKCAGKLKMCMMPEKHAPPPDTVIYAKSNYYHPMKALNISSTTYEEYLKKRTEYCSTKFSDVKKMVAKPKRAIDNCFKMNLINVVLTKLYKFEAKHWSNLRFANTINDQQLGWALGFMMHETNLIPSDEARDSVITITVFVIGLVVGLLLLAIGIFLVRKGAKNGDGRRERSSAKEQRALTDYNRNV